MRPSRPTLYVLVVLLLVAAAVGTVAIIAYGILSTRTAYFQQRNLRELDRIATELATTRESLRQVAALHFVPDQLNFSLSPQLECLVATMEIAGARRQPITISYAFTDPGGTSRLAESYVPASPQLPEAAAAPTPPGPAWLARICSYERPLGASPDERVTLGNGRIQVERTVPITDLLGPMTARVGNRARGEQVRSVPACAVDYDAEPVPVNTADLSAHINRCFYRAAMQDMQDETYSYRAPDQVGPAVQQSLDAAFRSNAVRLTASTPVAMLDIESALENFDAVQILQPDKPQPLLQVGRVPATVEGRDEDQTMLINNLLGVRSPSPAQQRSQQRSTGEPDYLTESRVVRTDNLVLFVRTTPGLMGMSCDPCRIVGIVSRAKFDQTVRKIDGVQATFLLIGVVTLIGLIPLVQLRLRKRLDATGRPGQYVIWFSLTLLAASATIASLAVWSSSTSRHVGAHEAEAAANEIQRAFNAELGSTLDLIGEIGRDLRRSETIFPAPETLPTIRQVLGQGGTGSSGEPAVDALNNAWNSHRQAAIIETVSYIRGDGSLDRETARLSAGRFPAFGTSIQNREYFTRASNREYSTFPAPDCHETNPTRFVMDRVFARPDGAPRTVWLLAETDSRLQPEACKQPHRTAKIDQSPIFDPASGQYLIASGTLRTFVGISLRPGFQYAVIDPNRRRDTPNVLFHSRAGSEFVESFEQELDDAAGFRTVVRQALARHHRAEERGASEPQGSQATSDTNAGAGNEAQPAAAAPDMNLQVGNDIQAAEAPSDTNLQVGHDIQTAEAGPDMNLQVSDDTTSVLARFDTNYRAQPVRLTVTRLNPNLDWILVVIEERDDAGFAVWRAATFGYMIWFIGALLVTLLVVIAHLRVPAGLDRRPGLAFWPRRRLTSFTPPRLERHEQMRARLAEAALLRDRHAWWVLVAGALGVIAAEGASRIMFAFAASVAMLCARAYFRGEAAYDNVAARTLDRNMVRSAWIAIGFTVVLFVYALAMEYRFRWFTENELDLFGILWRSALFSIATIMLVKCVLAARGFALESREEVPAGRWGRLVSTLQSWPRPQTPPPFDPSEGRWRRFMHRVRSMRAIQRTDVTWIVALFVLGALPAAAGFLDSHDEDRLLLSQRAEQVFQDLQQERTQAIDTINRLRLAKLPDNQISTIRTTPTANRILPRPRENAPSSYQCNSLSCLAIDYLDLEEQALEYSDFIRYEMFDPANIAPNWSRPFILLIGITIPIALLIAVLLYFRRLYFMNPPPISPGKDPEFEPPLALTRQAFISDALVPASRGKPPGLPFDPDGENRHLVLGAGVDLQDDRQPGKNQRVRDLTGLDWIDLLDETRDPDAYAKAVVVTNLDLALQVPDDGATVRRTYEALRKIGTWVDEADEGRHVFLLADIDPLDRIGLLWERQCSRQATGMVEAWQWAELLQDYTLVPIQRVNRVEFVDRESRVMRAIREELGVLDSQFANQLAQELSARLEPVANDPSRCDNADEVEKVVSFVAERMSDHYHKLWSGSSDEERVMLYRLARDAHLKMRDSRALRSLLARGLLIRVPEYRLMNRSFARYVVRVGEPSEIHSSAQRVGGVDWVWPLIRYPLIAIAGSAVILLQFLAPSGASGAVGALPALLALIPTLIGRWFQDRAAVT